MSTVKHDFTARVPFNHTKAPLALGLASLLALGPLGCVPNANMAKFNASRPIDLGRNGRFEQEGQPLALDDLNAKLREEDEAGVYARRANSFAFAGQIMAATGGGLMGVPIGQWVAREPEPLWVLGIVGLVVAAGGIAIGAASNGAMTDAVRAHNEEYAQKKASDEQRDRDYLRRHPKVVVPPPAPTNPDAEPARPDDPTGSSPPPESKSAAPPAASSVRAPARGADSLASPQE
jgi:hypothetical protein